MNTKTKERKIISLEKQLYWSIESVSDLIRLGNIDVENRICYPKLILFDDPSRNNSVYCGEDFRSSVTDSRFLQDQIRAGTWFGELGHPMLEEGQSRFMRIEMNNVSHRIMKYKFVGNEMHGVVRLCKPKGDILWDWVSSGSNIAFSVRALTPTFVKKKNEQGQVYIYKYGRMVIITFDSVTLPGIEIARIADVNKYDATVEDYEVAFNKMVKTNKKIENIKNSVESADWERMIKSNLFYNKQNKFNKSDLKEIVKSQESAHIIEDLFQFSLEDATISMDNENVIIRPFSDSKHSLVIPTNIYLINSMMKSNDSILNK